MLLDNPATDLPRAALRALRAAVGDGALVTAELPDELATYADPFAFADEYSHPPAAAVLPGCVDEVRDVLRTATRYGLALWTVSRGRNLAYGGAAARQPGSIVLDLRRMNKVLEVDDTLAYALVEPGVSFFDLAAHLRRGEHPLWPSVPDLGGGSVVGNALERGFGYTAYGDHSSMSCGLEVVLADGDVVRTGMGAQSGSPAWQAYQGGFGPSVDGLLRQSNLGVVTKMGVWLMPRPETAASVTVTVPDEPGLAPLVDALRVLMLSNVVPGVIMVGNALAVASMMGGRDRWYYGAGPIPAEVVKQIVKTLGIGWWNAKFGLYGPDDLVQARLKEVRRAVSRVPGAEVVVRSYPGDVAPGQVHPADRGQLGVPSSELIQMAGWRGGEAAHTDFSMVCPATGRHAEAQAALVRKRVHAAGFDYAGGFTMFGRHAISLCLLSFDRADAAQRTAVRELVPALIRDAGAAGYAPYRAHLAHMDLVADQFDFNAHALRRLHGRLKIALDPAGVLSAGKQGVWAAAGVRER